MDDFQPDNTVSDFQADDFQPDKQPQEKPMGLWDSVKTMAGNAVGQTPIGMASQATDTFNQGASKVMTPILPAETIGNAVRPIFQGSRGFGVGVAEQATGAQPGVITRKAIEGMRNNYQPEGPIEKVGAAIGQNLPTAGAYAIPGLGGEIAGPLTQMAQQASETGKVSPVPLIPGAIKLGKAVAKPLFSGSFGVPEESVSARFENPERIKNASTSQELAQNEIPRVARKYDQAISGLHGQAEKVLSKSRYLEPSETDIGGAIPKEDVINAIDSARRDLGRASTPEGQSASRSLANLKEQLKMLRNTVSQNELHSEIKNLDNEIPWKQIREGNRTGAPYQLTRQDEAYIKLRMSWDKILKDMNPDYAKNMEPMSELIGNRNQFTNTFKVYKEKGSMFAPSDQTSSRVRRATGEDKLFTKKILDKTNESIGENLSPKIQASNAKEDFQPIEKPTLRNIIGGPPMAGKLIDIASPVAKNLKGAIPPATRMNIGHKVINELRPKTVKQNGHVYNLNEKTGQYE